MCEKAFVALYSLNFGLMGHQSPYVGMHSAVLFDQGAAGYTAQLCLPDSHSREDTCELFLRFFFGWTAGRRKRYRAGGPDCALPLLGSQYLRKAMIQEDLLSLKQGQISP